MTFTCKFLCGYMFLIPLEVELLGHTLNLCFHTLRNCQAVFQSGCIILYPPQQCTRVPVPLYSH